MAYLPKRGSNSQSYAAIPPRLFFSLVSLLAGNAWAACDNTAPASGDTVSCVPSGGISDSVIAASGSNNVTATVSAGTISFSRIGIQVVGDSSVTNNGTINTAAGSGGGLKAAISALTNNNVITNNGTIAVTSPNIYGISVGTSAAGGGGTGNTVINALGSVITTQNGSSDAIHVVGGNNTITNSGSITTSGSSSTAIYAQGNANSFTNSGSILVQGNGSDGVFMNTVSPTFTSNITNLAGGSITSTQSYAIRGLNGSDTVINAGRLEGHGGASNDTAIILGNSRNNSLILRTGSQIVGAAEGGSGNSNVYLEGSGVVDSAFRNFNTLTMRGTAWDWTTDAAFNNTTIQSGTLTLNSVLTSPVHVDTAGTLTTPSGTTFVTNTAAGAVAGTVAGVLSGTGTVTGNLSNGGVVRPGDGNGTGALTITGNYINQGSGTLAIDLTPTSAGKLIVNGTVNIQGGQVTANFKPGNYDNFQQQEIIQCTGNCVTGSFDVYTPSAFVDTTVFNGAGNNGVFIGYQRNAVDFADVATTDNDKALAASLDANANAGGLSSTVNQLVAMSAAQAQTAFRSLGGGYVHATLAGLNMRQSGMFARALTQRLSGPLPRNMTRDSALWARPYYTRGDVNSDVVADVDYSINGLAAGMDRWITPDWLFGAGIDISQMRGDFSDYNAHAKTDAYQLGVYSSYQRDDFYVDGIFSVGWQKNTVERTINFANSSSQAKADYSGKNINLYAESGYKIPLAGALTFQPLASLAYVWQREPGFSESGAGEIGFNAASAATQSIRSGLGAALMKDFPMANGVLTLEGKARWLHEFGDRTPQLQAAFAGDVTGQRFTVQGAEGWQDAALLGLNVIYANNANTQIYLSYDATLAKRDTAHTVTAGLRYIW